MSASTEKTANASSDEPEQSEATSATVADEVIVRGNARRLTPEQMRAAANVLARIHSHPKRSGHVR